MDEEVYRLSDFVLKTWSKLLLMPTTIQRRQKTKYKMVVGLSDIANYRCVLVISLLGLVGNSLLIYVLIYQVVKKGIKMPFYYLLIGLTLSDILLLLLCTYRTTIYLGWVKINLNEPTVAKVDFIWDWICTSGTKYYTVTISLERYIAIGFPIQAHRFQTPSRAKKIVFGVLLIVLLLTACSYVYFHYWDTHSFQIYVAVTLHFFPFAAVLLLNALIYFGLRRHKKRRQKLSEIFATEETNATRMLLAVVWVFGVCYSFEFVRRVLNYFIDYDCYNCLLNQLANIFFVINSSVNIVVYCLMCKSFRDQFFTILYNTFHCTDKSWTEISLELRSQK